ncbi:MAG TPA: hypothetical protein VJR89_14925 [Polyangiales bacterium]|nr:hypothetical protein [Polyangiales bacterium]
MNALLFHPKLIHLPVALGVLMPLIAGGLLLAWWRGWLPPRAWLMAVALQAILVGPGVVALQSGEAEEERIESFVAEHLIEEHEQRAQAFVGASAAVLVLMLAAAALGSRRPALPTAAAAVLCTLLVSGLDYWAGQTGASLVYQHGAAQAYTSTTALGISDSTGSDDDDD